MNVDYHQLIDENGPAFKEELGADLVYMDPPYTGDNYSRFYHVLEVLASYDYPELARDNNGRILRGRYPEISSRFQSGFCKVTQVEREFERVIQATAGSRSKLVISYGSPNGLLLKRYATTRPGEDPVACLEGLCRQSYQRVHTLCQHLMHSGQGDSNIPTDELLVICTNPR